MSLWNVYVALKEFLIPHAIRWDTVESIPPRSLIGKSVLVTGANSGLGLEAAVHYVREGAERVYITARNVTRAEEAQVAIEERTEKMGVVQTRVLDMDTFEGVRGFVEGVRKDIKTIDIVLLNAGSHAVSYAPSPTGWEANLQVNVLSNALLGLLLLQWMRDIRKPGQRQALSFTASGSHMTPNIEAPDWPKQDILSFWNQPENFRSSRWNYGVSKLLLQYSIRELAEIARDDDGSPSPVVNSVCPGIVKTGIIRAFEAKGLFYKLVANFIMWWQGALPAEEGAKSLVVTSLSDKHGKFRRPWGTDEEYDEKVKVTFESAAGRRTQSKVWKEIVEVLKVQDPEVEKIVRL